MKYIEWLAGELKEAGFSSNGASVAETAKPGWRTDSRKYGLSSTKVMVSLKITERCDVQKAATILSNIGAIHFQVTATHLEVWVKRQDRRRKPC